MHACVCVAKPVAVELRCHATALIAYAKQRRTDQLCGNFVFSTWIEQSLLYINPKFQASSHLLWMNSQVCVDLVGNPEDRFSHNEAHICSIYRTVHLVFSKLSQKCLVEYLPNWPTLIKKNTNTIPK